MCTVQKTELTSPEDTCWAHTPGLTEIWPPSPKLNYTTVRLIISILYPLHIATLMQKRHPFTTTTFRTIPHLPLLAGLLTRRTRKGRNSLYKDPRPPPSLGPSAIWLIQPTSPQRARTAGIQVPRAVVGRLGGFFGAGCRVSEGGDGGCGGPGAGAEDGSAAFD